MDTRTKKKTFDPAEASDFCASRVGETNTDECGGIGGVWVKVMDVRQSPPVPTMPPEWVAAFKAGAQVAAEEIGAALEAFVWEAVDQHGLDKVPAWALLRVLAGASKDLGYPDGNEWLQDPRVPIDADGLVRLREPMPYGLALKEDLMRRSQVEVTLPAPPPHA